MKKLLFLTLIGSLFLASCSSDEPLSSPIDAGTPKVPVTINVTSNNEFNELKSVSPADIGLESLYYFVYDEATGNFIKQKFFSADNMAVIKDSLPEGRYRIAVIAAKAYGYLEDGKGFVYEKFPNANINFNLASFEFWGFYSQDTEVFYSNSVINVGKTGVQESIVLKRISSKIDIIPEDLDKLPKNAGYMKFTILNIGAQQFNFADNKYTSIPYYLPSGPFELVTITLTIDELKNVNADNPIVLPALPLKSSLEELDENGKPKIFPIAVDLVSIEGWPTKITIKNEYTLEQNKILRLRGNLFDKKTESEVSINDEWDSEIVEENFD